MLRDAYAFAIRPMTEAVMEILKYPHPKLRERGEEITRIDNELIRRAHEMFEIMYANRGCGLAAPQVGWSVRLHVINISGDKSQGEELVFINPVIVSASGSSFEEEGCLSVPGINAKVKRAARVSVKAFDLKGEEFEIEADGILATALQHETDHLDGVLFISKLTRAGRIANARKIKAMEERFRAEHPEIPAACLT